MSEMVDKVSAALAQSFKDAVAASAGMAFEETGVTLPQKAVWDRYARVAIKALREPTKAMAFEGYGVMPESDGEGGAWNTSESATELWHAMIDKALE